MTSLQKRIDELGITMDLRVAKTNPYMKDMGPGAHHYRVTLKAPGGRVLRTPFSTGIGWERDPTVADVLECLLSDAAGIENAEFNLGEWLADYSLDNNSGNHAMFNRVENQTRALRDFLGNYYSAWLWETEG